MDGYLNQDAAEACMELRLDGRPRKENQDQLITAAFHIVVRPRPRDQRRAQGHMLRLPHHCPSTTQPPAEAPRQ